MLHLRLVAVRRRTIRRAVVADARVVATIHVRGWQWGYRGAMPEELLASLSVDGREQKWRPQLEPTYPPRTWLLEEDDSPVAFATCGPARDSDVLEETGELYAMYQLETVAGTGAGRALMEHVLDDLQQQGFQRAILWVLEGNQRARRFYEKAGWLPDGKAKAEPATEGIRREVRYAKDLG
jgi:GNAT superfamily N-acetyltransferase